MQVAQVAPLTVKFGRQTHEVMSVEDAQAKWNAFRDASGAGVSEIGNGIIIRRGKQIIGRVSYNGRFWPGEK